MRIRLAVCPLCAAQAEQNEMPQSRAPKQCTPVVINSTSERILKAVHELGVVTNREITELFFKSGSR